MKNNQEKDYSLLELLLIVENTKNQTLLKLLLKEIKEKEKEIKCKRLKLKK